MDERFSAVSAPGPEAGLLVALEHQAATLALLAVEVGDIRRELPNAGDSDVWSGLAHAGYVAGVVALTHGLATAEAAVDRAVQHTRRAVATMAGHVG
jgi:hypothetical protein